MAKDRMAVLTALMDQGVIPVFFHPDLQTCLGVIQACADAGAKCFEFTNRAKINTKFSAASEKFWKKPKKTRFSSTRF